MGAEKISLGRLRELTPIERRLGKEGKLVLTGEELLKNLRDPPPCGLLVIGNTQVTLHIFEPRARPGFDRANDPKFHVAFCKTLEEMEAKGRFDRYVANSHPGGKKSPFEISPWNPDTGKNEGKEKAELLVCQNCMTHLNYNDFNTLPKGYPRLQFVKNFDLEKFLETHQPIFRTLPIYTAANFPGGGYPANFSEISIKFRQSKDWRCECCRANFSRRHGLLHTHHKNGNPAESGLGNLAALCALCHKKQPMHNHMHISRKDEAAIMAIRQKQGLDIRCSKCDS